MKFIKGQKRTLPQVCGSSRGTGRVRAIALLALSFFTAFVSLRLPVSAIAASTHSKVSEGVYQLPDGTQIAGIIARGIDVSHWQGEIDWNQAAQDDISFAMLGTRYKGEVDPLFRSFASGASAVGIRLGAYIYAYATTVEEAEAEADFVLNLVKDYPISYPIAYDMEDSTLSVLTSDQLADLANAFCTKIRAAGYYPIIYANDHWLENYLDMSKMDYDVWVARYETPHAYPDPVMWQATESGSVSGIDGGCDIDFQYKDFSGLIASDLWRTIGGEIYYYKNYIMQKNAWIHDGSGWFYMNSLGHPLTGWFAQNGKTYYLDAASGRMVEGWQNTLDGWLFFGTDGAMRTGWVEDNGTRYYLNNNGIMQTGWLNDGGLWYFLRNDGGMQTGWLNDGGLWYFLRNDGGMQTGWLDDAGTWYFLSESGGMAVGWRLIGDAWYYFSGSGAMQTGWIAGSDGARYYLDPSSGRMAADMQITVDGVNYLADANGVCTEIKPETWPTVSQTAPQGADTQLIPGEPQISAPSVSNGNMKELPLIEPFPG